MGVAWRLAKGAFGLGLAALAVTIAAVVHTTGRNYDLYGWGRGLERPVDAIIVLAGGIDPDGVIGYSSRRRVEVAVDLLAVGRTGRLILSGGRTGWIEAPPAAALMREYALELGAPPEALLVEDRSASTFENLRMALALAEAEGFGRLAILTEAYHLERARLLAGYFGHPDIGLVAADGFSSNITFDRAASTTREALAWWLNLGKVVGWETLAIAGVKPEARREWIR